MKHSNPETVEFTAKEIALVKAAIRASREDMDEWREATRVDPEKIREPMGPAGGRWPHQRS